mgnify:CR=1 FL=1
MTGSGCFNLNLLECKSDISTVSRASVAVLISTYWNVNLLDNEGTLLEYEVLISTYWNVNHFMFC